MIWLQLLNENKLVKQGCFSLWQFVQIEGIEYRILYIISTLLVERMLDEFGVTMGCGMSRLAERLTLDLEGYPAYM